MGQDPDLPALRAARTPRVPALDGFRAYAILGVVAVHLMGASGVLARTDGTDAGVLIWSIFGNSIDVFFIVSGFVLFLPTIVRHGDFGSRSTFWVGRATRLLPAFWLVVAITLLLVAVKPPLPDYAFPSVEEILAHVTVLQMPVQFFDAGFRIGFGVNGPLWMVSVALTFYLVLPFVARAYYRHPLIGLAAAAAITVVWKQAIARVPEAFDFLSNGSEEFARLLAVDQFPGWAFSFGLGMTGAWAYRWARDRYPSERLARAALLAAPAVLLVYAIGAYLLGHHALTVPGNVGQVARTYTLDSLINSAARAALMGVVLLGPLWLARPFANRIAARLAELSYGIYLIHWVLIMYAVDLLDLPRDGTITALAVWFAVILPPALIYAALSRRYLELPVLRWVRRRRAVVGSTPPGPLEPAVRYSPGE